MRMSETRIRALAKTIAKDMIDQGAVEGKISVLNLSTLIAQVMIQDLKVEDEIDEEVRQRLLRYPRLPPEGSGEYEALFFKVKSEIASKRGYPL